MATGSEVAIAMNAAAKLEGQGVGVRVVSMPCTEIFAEQPHAYQSEVLPRDPSLVRVSLEAGSTFGWERFTMFGPKDIRIGVNKFGASAPAPVLYKKYGIDEESVITKITNALKG
jgi:transketolase